jgi:hypothetical protein
MDVDDLRQQAAEELAERQSLERVVDIDADARPDPLAALRELPDDDQPIWRHNP